MSSLTKYLLGTSGVSQSDHYLSPLLFYIFINNLPEVIENSNILLCANDANIFKEIKNKKF